MSEFLSSNQEEVFYENNTVKSKKRTVGDFITLLLFLLCAFLVFTKFFWLFCVEVDGSSMNSTLVHGDLLLVDKLAKPDRGDVIVFTLNDKAYIKRVVAIEGDVVRIEGGNLYVKESGDSNFKLVSYDGVVGRTYYQNNSTFTLEWVVQPDCFYVLGDNRENSVDSRSFGEINIELVNGVVHQFIIDNKDEQLGKFYKYL